MTHRNIILASACLSATHAAAQPMASITVTANGGGSATVQPGEPVTIRANFWQNGWCIGRAEGSTVDTNDAGHASNFSSWLPVLPTINFGSFQGSSRLGTEFAFTPPGFLGASTRPRA